MIRKPTSLIFVLLMSAAVVALAACSGGSDEVVVDPTNVTTIDPTTRPDDSTATSKPEPTERSDDPSSPVSPTETTRATGSSTPADPEIDRPTATPTQDRVVDEPEPEFSPLALPTRPITFNVTVPSNTPANDPVFLTIVDITGGESDRIRMKKLVDGTFETQAQVPNNAVIRYTYDRFEYKDVCCLQAESRESLGESFRLQYRFLLTKTELDRVNDTIGMWADLREPFVEGEITGTVFDSSTGEPVLDADVSVSGVHVGTRVDGSFKVPRLPAGEHKPRANTKF